MEKTKIIVIGAGLAGCEAALSLADDGFCVELIDCKPHSMSEAHHSPLFAEIVCSNSLKSNDVNTASGLLKEELRLLGGKLIKIADEVRVPAGGALAVDREQFAAKVTTLINQHPNINVVNKRVDEPDLSFPTIIATGPLTQGGLLDWININLGGCLHFFDAAAPIVSFESINNSLTFAGSRYGKGEDDYINCPFSKEEYERFFAELVSADCLVPKGFEKDVFEGCMPIEVMAKRGIDTLRFGPLKPVGFVDPNTGKRPYALVQLRKETIEGKAYNLVGFQTNLKFGEQKRVFSMIPGLKDAEFLRYGVMHKNAYINAPDVIDQTLCANKFGSLFFSGQLSGVEGYVESMATGRIAAMNIARSLRAQPRLFLPRETIIGGLLSYLTVKNVDFQPMNANFGLLPPLENHVRDKSLKKNLLAKRSIDAIKNIKND